MCIRDSLIIAYNAEMKADATPTDAGQVVLIINNPMPLIENEEDLTE